MKAKKMIGIILAAALSLGALAGCGPSGGGRESQKDTDENADGAKGRYLESDIELPEKTSIYGMTKLDNGTIRIAANDQEGLAAVWDLKEDGETWEKVYDMPKEWKQTDDFFLTHVGLSPKGDAFAVTSQTLEQPQEIQESEENVMMAKQSQEHFYHLDKEGNATEVPLKTEEYVYRLQYSKEGELLAQFQNMPVSSVHMETGELTDKAAGSDRTAFFGMAGNTQIGRASCRERVLAGV